MSRIGGTQAVVQRDVLRGADVEGDLVALLEAHGHSNHPLAVQADDDMLLPDPRDQILPLLPEESCVLDIPDLGTHP